MHATTPNLATRRNTATSTLVDGASLAVARMALGAVAVFSAARTVRYGWIDSLYAGPTHRFTYLWMGWVPQPAPALAWLLITTTALAGVAIAIGWRTRAACATLLVSFGWIEFTDATTYLNHYWFVTLLAALGMVVPFGRTWSLDARRTPADPLVARGWVWLLRFQVAMVYASAGLAKLQADWLLRAEPLRYWLPARANTPVIGGWLRFTETAHLLSVAGAVFDCAIVPLLLWRKTRFVAWLALVTFHVVTWSLFPIGVFPWLMIAMATIFFDPSWPRAALARIQHLAPQHRVPAKDPATPTVAARWRSGATRALASGALAIWVLVQVALPLRHLAYPGDHRWTAEGYRFGWNVLLVERVGSVTFLVHDPATGRTWTADPSTLYTETQLRAMAGEPDLIHQAAKAIAADEAASGREVEVRVDAWLSLNGRPAAPWIDPTVDLAAEPRSLWHKTWILPAP